MLTNSSGIATSPTFTANNVAGKFTATATTAGITEPASFQLDNLAGKPPLLQPVGKPKLSATVGARYARALQVKLTDASGAALEGMSVTFSLGSGGGAGASGAGAGERRGELPRREHANDRDDGRVRGRDLTLVRREHDRRHLHRDRNGRRRHQPGAVHARQPRRHAAHDQEARTGETLRHRG